MARTIADASGDLCRASGFIDERRQCRDEGARGTHGTALKKRSRID
jgi:hypothetical protein